MFKRSNFCHVASNNRNNVKAGLFVYRTTDDLDTVTASGYFNDMIIDINLHDLIIHEQIDSSDNTKVQRNLLCVTERTLENVGTSTIKSDWEEQVEELLNQGFVKTDGSSVMTGALKFSAGSMRGAISGGLNGLTFFKMDSQGNLIQIAHLSDTQFVPASDNTMDLGTSARSLKTVYVKKLNNGYDINVPVTASADTLALKSQVDDAANSGEQLYATGVWYAKMYAATTVPTGAEYNGRKYADFSQVDGDNNPVIKIYTGASGAWTLTQTITPPANHNGYITVTSKIWDIVEQAGQQGGRILWNHQSKEFTPYPQIISFKDAALTGVPTAPLADASSPNNQIATKEYVDNATSGNGYHPELLSHEWDDHERNNMSWVNALTFSWKDSSFYKAAYDHLVDDITTTTLLPYVTLNGNNYYRTPSFDEPGQNHPYAYVYNNHSGTIDIKYSDFSTGALSETYWPSATATTGGIVANDGGQEYIPAKQYETISGVTIGYYVTSDGHKIVDAADENLVASIYTATGVAWYYILDTTNQRFKLPRAKNFTGSVIGNGITLGLTDGSETFGLMNSSNTTISTAGASYLYGKNVGTEYQAPQQSSNKSFGVTTDSTKSGIIAERDTTDQYKYLYFYVGNFTQEAIENTAGLNASLFNGKADTDLGNVSAGIDFVVESQLPTSGNNYTWYRKYKSGWVEQGGIVLDSESGNYTVNLPVTMADTNYDIQLTCKQDANGALAYYMNQTTTSFVRETTNRGGTTAGRETKWRVEGMAA